MGLILERHFSADAKIESQKGQKTEIDMDPFTSLLFFRVWQQVFKRCHLENIQRYHMWFLKMVGGGLRHLGNSYVGYRGAIGVPNTDLTSFLFLSSSNA